MQYRTLGRTGVKVSAIGLGGYHIGVQSDPAESVRMVRTAIDRGITFMDNSWDYNDGASESRMGDALKDGYRNKVFLMTKIDGRSAQSFNTQLEQSLARLKGEHHRSDAISRAHSHGGPRPHLRRRRRAGGRPRSQKGGQDPLHRIHRPQGPCHSPAHVRDRQQHGFHFDTVQMPINVLDAQFRSFNKQVIPVARAQGTAVLAMKTLSAGILLRSNTVSAIEALHYALSQPVSVVITGMDTMQIMEQAFTAMRTFKPLTESETASLLARTRDAALSGQFEPFKTTARFDGSARNPDWLG